MIPIPNCCAMPLNTKVGASYVCLTCGTTYRHLVGGWTLAGPIVDLAPELQAVDPTCARPGCSSPRSCTHSVREHPYETTLDTDERTGN